MAEKTRKITIKAFFQALLNYLGHDLLAIIGSFLVFFAITKLIFSKASSIPLLDVFWKVWLFASIVAALIYFFAEINRYIHKGIAPRFLPVIPSLILGIVFITIEFSFSVYILSFSKRFFALPSLSALLILMFSVLLIELFRRHSKVMLGFKNVSLKISSFIKLTVENVERSWLSIVYWVVSLIFIILSCFFIYKGYITPFDNHPDSANELFSNVLTIVTGILTIFFAGATLVMQLIVGTYSYKFVESLFRSHIFVSSFLIYLLIGIAHLVFLRIGWNDYFATFSIASAIYILLSLVILLVHFKDWVQVPYVIGIVTNDIQKYIGKFRKPKVRPRRDDLQSKTPSLKFRFRSYFLTAFLGESYKNPYLEEWASLRFPTQIQKKIIEDTRPLLTACLKAVNEDRREVVLACLYGVDKISETYIDKFGDLIFATDDFFMFLNDQLSIIYETAVESKNQQFTSDIVDVVIKIGKSCLALTNARENNHVFIWVDFLRESVVKGLHLQRTSAQMAACTGIVDIGKLLIEQNAYPTALHVTVAALHKIGKVVAGIKHMWPAAITVRVNGGVMDLLAFYIIKAWRSNSHYEAFIEDACRKIFEVSDLAYKKQSDDVLTLTSISNSLVGRNSGLNLTGIVSVVLRYWQGESSRTHYVLLSGVRDLIFLLNQLSQSAIGVKAYAVEDYCSTLSEIGNMLVEFIVKVKEKHAIEIARKDLKLVMGIAEHLLNGIIKNQPNNSYESFNELSFLYASLIFHSDKIEDDFFLNLYNENIKKMTDVVNVTAQEELDSRGYRILYSYINLFGAWLFNFNPSHKENKSLRRFIRQKKFLQFLLEDSNYPDFFTSDDYRSLGINAWRFQDGTMLDTLRDRKIYSNFDNFLKIKR